MSAPRRAGPLLAAGVLVLPALAGIAYSALAAIGLAGPGAGVMTSAPVRAVLADPEVLRGAAWTLATGAVAAWLSLEGAVRLASRLPPDGALARTLLAPLAVPHAGAAIAMLWLLAPAGLVARVLHALGVVAVPAQMPQLVHDAAGIGFVAAAVWKELPFLLVVASGARRRDAARLVEGARTVGASPAIARRRVVEPHLRRATLPAAAAAFAFLTGCYELPALLGPSAPPALPLLAYERWTDLLLATRAEAHVLALLALVPALAAAVVGARAWRRATTA